MKPESAMDFLLPPTLEEIEESDRWDSLAQSYPNFILSAKALSQQDVSGGRVLPVSRQSSDNNAHGHSVKDSMLRKTHERLAPGEPFKPLRITASGNLSLLRSLYVLDAVDARRAIRGTYFGDLIDGIEKELGRASGGKVHIVIPLIDRLFRPSGYQAKKTTWDATENDYKIFHKLLYRCLGKSAANIVFVLADDSAPSQCRGIATRLGQSASGNRGGRPPTAKRDALRGKFHLKRYLAREAVQLRITQNWNARKVADFLNEKYLVCVSVKTCQRWLAETGLSEHAGRPPKKKNATF